MSSTTQHHAVREWFTGDWDYMTEAQLAERFDVSEGAHFAGVTFEQVAEVAKIEYEQTLPAGTVIGVGGHSLVLNAPVNVTSLEGKPALVIEGWTAEGSDDDAAWPEAVKLSMVPKPAYTKRRCVCAFLDRASVPAKEG